MSKTADTNPKPWHVNVTLDTLTRLTKRNREMEAALRWIQEQVHFHNLPPLVAIANKCREALTTGEGE